MLVPMGSSGGFYLGADRGLFCPLRGPDAIADHPSLRARAKQSMARHSDHGLLRRAAPRNDGVQPTKKAPAGASSNLRHSGPAQCASAQTFFLVKYIIPAKMIRDTNT